eukprot:TRINITY_DN9061_c0_g1_i1.p1 TRINITY_DN9061_c0_g1~~TRINITY_DN9061_c0_g1_i1.p1  ORF type:complete len:137 (-),score=23.51 TRINITY_DN9061_c0_g1_i1:113-523(-)
MSMTCEVSDELVAEYQKFVKSRKYNTAFVMKINKEAHKVELEDIITHGDIEEIAEDLNPIDPRYIVWSAELSLPDGRKKYPIAMIFYIPSTNPATATVYAATLKTLEKKLNMQKTFELRDADDLTKEWLSDRLMKI